jgi:hypothetical protein
MLLATMQAVMSVICRLAAASCWVGDAVDNACLILCAGTAAGACSVCKP